MAARYILVGVAAMIVACGRAASDGTNAKGDASDGAVCLGQESANPASGLQCQTSYFGIICTCGAGEPACVCDPTANPHAVPFDGCPCCPSAEVALSVCGVDASAE
jgi:hypothetical protein